MADIVEWDPVDDANTDAPPNGWPEFMQPSAVNNSARAMMGAIRRWYNTVTAQLASLTTTVNSKVTKTGDTMTGQLKITTTSLQFAVNKVTSGSGQTADILGQANNLMRWHIQLCGSDIEAGGNTGSSFNIHRYADNGAYLGLVMTMNRQTGEVSVGGNIVISGVATASAHATRKDYVDQRDTDWYNAAWTNITNWAAGNDNTVYTNATNYALGLHNSQQSYINSGDNARVSKGGDTMTGSLTVPYIVGNVSTVGAGTLRTRGDTNSVCFRWDGLRLYYRIDETVEAKIADTRNAYSIGFDPGGGGPIGWVFSANDGSTWFYLNVDSIAPSDERVKINIAQSEIDALGLLNQVKLSQFDFKADVVGWYQSVGKTPEERAQMMAAAEAAHVDIGFVAQQVRGIIPEAVSVAPQKGLSPDGPLPDDMLTISNPAFVPYLVRAVQQLAARVEALEAK